LGSFNAKNYYYNPTERKKTIALISIHRSSFGLLLVDFLSFFFLFRFVSVILTLSFKKLKL